MKILREVKKEDDLYLVGAFWVIGKSVEDINAGRFKILSEKFLADYDGDVINRVPRAEFTHKGIWEKKYQGVYGVPYDYFPRGRVSQKQGIAYLNLPNGVNTQIVVDAIRKEFDVHSDFALIKCTDPTTGGHYSFRLL